MKALLTGSLLQLHGPHSSGREGGFPLLPGESLDLGSQRGQVKEEQQEEEEEQRVSLTAEQPEC